MPLSNIDVAYVKQSLDRYYQGNILRDIKVVEWAEEACIEEEKEGERVKSKSIEIRERAIPYSVVLTQDCDLEQDYNNRLKFDSPDNDKYIHSILLCQAHLAERLRLGTHLEDIGIRMRKINSDDWKQLKGNNLYRYHFLEAYQDLQIPELVIDFKHYLTIPRDILYTEAYKKQYLATISALFREDLSVRYSQYLSRIGLPDLSRSPQAI
jgi:hypothetical protein